MKETTSAVSVAVRRTQEQYFDTVAACRQPRRQMRDIGKVPEHDSAHWDRIQASAQGLKAFESNFVPLTNRKLKVVIVILFNSTAYHCFKPSVFEWRWLMGILRNSRWDAFSSYSGLDDKLYRGWIKDFTIELKTRVHLLLQQKGYRFGLDELEFFFDKESMPANGPLEEELIKHIKTSGFLLLFVGDNYLNSPWCGKELDWFSSRFSGIPKEALKNMFMIMLTPTAVRNASSDASKSLQKIKANGIFQLAYAPSSELPIEPQFPDISGVLHTNPEYAKLVDKIAKTLAGRFIDAGLKTIADTDPDPGASSKPSPIGNVIAFGVVSRSLRDYRSKLAASVAAKLNTKVDCWEWEDLGDPTELGTRLEQAQVFIQLVDKSPIGILGGSQPGGFLAAQKDLVKNTPLLWIDPLDGDKPDPEEHNPDHVNFLTTVMSGALKLSADNIVLEIAQRLAAPGGDLKYARIMIEHSDEDQEEVFRVREIIKQAWGNISKPDLPLRFSGADWTAMKEAPDKFKSCHGIVVVDRSRPWATLEAQLGDIEDELAKRNQTLAYRTFVLPPKSKATILNWEFIRFQKANDDGHVEVITQGALDKFLARVQERALAFDLER
jgi:hypothetical protein